MSTHDPVRSEEVRRFGLLLARHRRGRGLTQARLAEHAGMHHNAVSLIERGRLSPTLTSLLALSRALGVPLAGLMADLESDLQAEPRTT